MKNMKFTLLILLLTFASCGQSQQTSRSPENDALLRAARAGHADTVKSLLGSPGVDVNVRDENGGTALIEAARNGHDDVVQALLNAGANTTIKDNQGNTALMYASQGGHTETVRLLRQSGATQ